MNRSLFRLLTAVLPLLVVIALAGPTAAAVRCGEERWAVKTLSDPHAAEVDFSPRDTTVERLRRFNNPGVGSDDPRTAPVEFRTYRVRARLKLATKEDDRDIHLVIGAPSAPGKEMIVEFPMVRCQGAASSIKKGAMRRARADLLNACGDIGSRASNSFTVLLASRASASGTSTTARPASRLTRSSSTRS
jgi:hypothetical protein